MSPVFVALIVGLVIGAAIGVFAMGVCQMIKERKNIDCSQFYHYEKILWDELPIWYLQFLSSSPPDMKTEIRAKQELSRRLGGL